MKTFNLKMTALALAATFALASGAQSASLYDDDDGDNANQYNRQPQSAHCSKYPDDEACNPYGKPRYKPKSYDNSYESGGHCAPLVRAVGKRNLVLGFARNSAMFAWRREARFVHGDQYANWGNAHNAHISCTRVGALASCEATATPCR